MESLSGLSDDDDDNDDRDDDDDVMMVIITLLVGNPCHPESVARRQRTTIRNPGAHALLLLCLKTLFKFLIRNLRESVCGRIIMSARSFKFQKGEWEAHLVLNSLHTDCFRCKTHKSSGM